MATKQEGTLTNKRGQKLYTASFVPSGPARAVCVFHHGLGEHSGRYDKVLLKLAESGIIVHTLDAHNHGKSESTNPADRGYIGSFQWLVDDVNELVQDIQKKAEGTPAAKLPLFMAGHSTGGLVAVYVVMQAPADRFKGLLLHSPCLDVEWTMALNVQSYVGRLLSWLAPSARVVAAVRAEDMSQDPEAVKRFLEDPLIVRGPTCARTACVILDSFVALGPKAHTITIPLYVAHGTMDKCTSYPAAQRFVQKVSSTDKTLKPFEGGFHELLLGPEQDEATELIKEWILKRL